MLKKKYRLPSGIRLEKARIKSFKYFVLKTAGNNFSYPRFAFVISKKVDTKAVVRNRIKREMTNAISKIIDKITAHTDMIFILKKEAVGNRSLLQQAVSDAFSQEGLFK